MHPRTALLIFGLFLAATPARAQESSWEAAARCRDDGDRALCWVRVMNAGPNRLPDPELARNPEIAAALGLPAPQADFAPPDDLAPGAAPASVQPFVEALDLATAAVQRGAASAEIISILQRLPAADPPIMANPLSDIGLSFGRLDAYSLMVEATHTRHPGLSADLLAAWEADLPEADSAAPENGAAALADVLARRGDLNGAERVLATLSPENEPAAIRILSQHGRFEAAEALALRATAANREAGLAAEDAASARHSAPLIAEMQRQVAVRIEESVATLPEGERAETRAGLREWLGGEAPSLNRAMRDGEPLRDVAEAELLDARFDLMDAAARAGRFDIADPLALALFQPVRRERIETAQRRFAALTVLARPGAPDAVARMDIAEQRAEALDRRWMPLVAIYEGWMRIGRTDRADALLARWRPFAERQARAWRDRVDTRQHPLLINGSEAPVGTAMTHILLARDDIPAAEALGMLDLSSIIWRDFDHGLGLSRLDERLAGRSLEVQAQLLLACSGRAQELRRWDDADACLRRLEQRAPEGRMRAALAYQFLSLATKLATAEEADKADARLVDAVSHGMAASAEDRSMFDFSLYLALGEVGKSMLREQGRLPARAIGGTT